MRNLIKIISFLLVVCFALSACGAPEDVTGEDMNSAMDLPLEIPESEENEDNKEKEMIEELKNSTAAPTTMNMLEASEFYRPLGRTAMFGTSLTCDWTAAGVEFKLLCKGDVSLVITSSTSTNTFTIEVDDVVTEKHFLVNKGTGTYTVASGLEAGYHTVKILAEKGYGNNAAVDSVTFTGELVEADKKDIYIEVIGDSITCGSGLGENGNDGTAAYDQKKKRRFMKMCALSSATNVKVKRGANGFLVSYKFEGKSYVVKFK